MKNLTLINVSIIRSILVSSVMIAACCVATFAQAAPYQDAVISLEPTYYYQLNETSTAGGAVDSMGNAAPGSYNGSYGFGGAQVGFPGPLIVFDGDDGIAVPGVGGEANLAHLSNDVGHITLGDGEDFASSAMTVSMFFKAGRADGGDRLFTNNLTNPLTSFQLNVANDGLVVAVDPNSTGLSAERTLFLPDNSGPDRRLIDPASGWFHVVASTFGNSGFERAANIRVWINGEDRTSNLQPNVTGWHTDTGLAKIGGRKANAADSTTHSGAQDEVAIWLNRVLTDEEVAAIWTAATTTKTFLPGDINLDDTVNRTDVAQFVPNLGSGEGTFESGDFDSDSVTGLSDLAALQANFGITVSPAASGAAVPEPSSIVLLLFGVSCFGVRRRRR